MDSGIDEEGRIRITEQLAETGMFGQITELEHLGRGGFASAYRVHSTNDPEGKLVAKIARNSMTTDDTSRYVKLCCEEKIKSPCLAKIYFNEPKNNAMVTVMDYCPGENLYTLAKKAIAEPEKHSSLAIEAAENSCAGLLEGLEELHSHRLVHRDIKPPNIVYNREDGTAKFVDFDSTTEYLEPEQFYLAGTTHCYVAPECFSKDHCDYKKDDIWALGITMLEFLTITGKMSTNPIFQFAQQTSSDFEKIKDMLTASSGAAKIIKSNKEGWLKFVNDKIDSIGDKLKNPIFWKKLLSGILEPDPKLRLSATEARVLAEKEEVRRKEEKMKTASPDKNHGSQGKEAVTERNLSDFPGKIDDIPPRVDKITGTKKNGEKGDRPREKAQEDKLKEVKDRSVDSVKEASERHSGPTEHSEKPTMLEKPSRDSEERPKKGSKGSPEPHIGTSEGKAEISPQRGEISAPNAASPPTAQKIILDGTLNVFRGVITTADYPEKDSTIPPISSPVTPLTNGSGAPGVGL
ncbi:MAG: protein kinase [Rickettsiales bacterium]|jgi:serine/threonine protein kinase|nr:protein kinase [Rickettsiales bacterium]